MRDVITIFAAGLLMAGYALVAPSFIGAVQNQAPVSHKAYAQRLVQVGGDTPVSTANGNGVVKVAASSALPFFAR